MPFFPSSSGVQINGGNFYDIAGDMNLQSAQPPRADSEQLTPLQSLGLLLGPAEHEQHAGATMMLSYVCAHRDAASTVMLRPPLPSPSIPPIYHGQSQLEFDQSFEYPPSTTESSLRAELPDTYYGANFLNRAIEYPSKNYEERSPPGIRPSPNDFCSEAPLNFNAVNYAVLPWAGSHEPKTNINGGTFIGGNVNHIQHGRGEPGLHILHRAAAGDALHDSGERYPQPRCHPETRTQLLESLYKWSKKSRTALLWLYGPAGAGKSAIAQSLCHKLELGGRLGGSFFFKRGHASRGNAMKLFPTIAYQLALVLPEFKRAVVESVENDPSIVDRSLSVQLQKLIIEPRRANISRRTLVFVIDGLDKCEEQPFQQEILRSIGNAIQQKQLPLRFLVASRAEPHIGEVFREPCLDGVHRPLNIHQSFRDVRTYLREEFSRIHHEHHETMGRFPWPWPSETVVEGLVEKSSGYFVYASTVVKFVDDKNFRPTDRLDIILDIAEPDVGSESPFGAIDQLYTQILSAVPSRYQLLKSLNLLELRPGDVRLALRGLHSVVQLPLDDEDLSLRLTVHHASFLDFLSDPTRSGIFYVAGPEHRTELARQILKALSNTHDDPSLNRNGGHVAW
ncbi:hypothetical protein DFH09DRAFT_1401111 [Mycena vulgaris]|nr:hypothetical protein DFH09DRAFT_1401111 [Mycena vulgaris]